jgi:hypothetical protein
MGATLLHVIFINIFAIGVEYAILKRRFHASKLMLRVILSNLLSVLAGTIVIYTIPELIGGAVGRPDDYIYTNYDKFAMAVGLVCLFLSNVLIETPAYIVAAGVKMKDVWRLISLIFVANLVTNIPVIAIYMLFVI